MYAQCVIVPADSRLAALAAGRYETRGMTLAARLLLLLVLVLSAGCSACSSESASETETVDEGVPKPEWRTAVAIVDELAYAGRHHTDSELEHLYFFWNSDLHVALPRRCWVKQFVRIPAIWRNSLAVSLRKPEINGIFCEFTVFYEKITS